MTYDPVKNWKGREWTYNATLYPSGGEAFVEKLGNLSMTCVSRAARRFGPSLLLLRDALALPRRYYTNGFVAENAYAARYAWTKEQEPRASSPAPPRPATAERRRRSPAPPEPPTAKRRLFREDSLKECAEPPCAAPALAPPPRRLSSVLGGSRSR